MAHQYWRIEPLWQGQTVFIIAGGTSILRQNIGALEGRNVIAVNSSYEVAPFAQYCYFGDCRWYNEHKDRPLFKRFAGKKVTCSEAAHGEELVHLKRVVPPPGFADHPTCVASQRSSMQGAMNMSAHLGVGKIVLLGADACRGPDGRTHHHRPHIWANKPGNGTWDYQIPDLEGIVDPLRKRGIEVLNASPISRLPWWPKVNFEDCLR